MRARQKLEMHLAEARDGLAGLPALSLPFFAEKMLKTLVHLVEAVDFVALRKKDPFEAAEPKEGPRVFCQVCDRIAFSASVDPRVCPSCLVAAMDEHQTTDLVADDPIAVYLLEWFLRHYSEREVAAELERRYLRTRPRPVEVAS